MKTIYLLIVAAVFASCSPTSHVPTMPSEPNFTGALQAQATGGVATDHIELQGAVSVLPFLGVTYDYYWGTKGINQQEYGANLFFPVNNQKTWFISFSAGKGNGIFNGDYKTSSALVGAEKSYAIDTKFNSEYLQASTYYVDKSNTDVIVKYSIAFKQENISYDRFKVAYRSRSGQSYYTYNILSEAENARTTIKTAFIGVTVEPKKRPLIMQFQLGVRDVTRGFKTTITAMSGGTSIKSGIDILNAQLHPLFEPFMFNMTVGFKLDYFKHRNKKKI